MTHSFRVAVHCHLSSCFETCGGTLYYGRSTWRRRPVLSHDDQETRERGREQGQDANVPSRAHPHGLTSSQEAPSPKSLPFNGPTSENHTFNMQAFGEMLKTEVKAWCYFSV